MTSMMYVDTKPGKCIWHISDKTKYQFLDRLEVILHYCDNNVNRPSYIFRYISYMVLYCYFSLSLIKRALHWEFTGSQVRKTEKNLIYQLYFYSFHFHSYPCFHVVFSISLRKKSLRTPGSTLSGNFLKYANK